MITAEDDITAWVKSYTNEMLGFTLAKVHQKEVAEDLIQDTFLSAYQSYKNFKGNSSAKTWLFSILKHKIADHFRDQYKRSAVNQSFDPLEICFDKDGSWNPCHKPQDWQFDEEELLDNPEFNEVLKSCYENMPAKWGSAVQLKYFHQDNSDEICQKLKITVTNFWQMIHRAKIMLCFCLETNWFKREKAI